MASPDCADHAVDPCGRAAIAWMVLLTSGSMTDTQHAKFREWLSISPENANAWSAMTGALGPVDVLARSGLDTRSIMGRVPSGSSRRQVLTGMVGVAGGALIGNRMLPLRDLLADRVTRTAQIAEIALDDRSTLILAPRSAVNLQLDQPIRRVRLIDGQCVAKIAAESGPLVIEADQFRFETESGVFAVARQRDGISVTDASGTGVLHHSAGGRWTISSNDVITVSDGQMRRTRTDASAQIAWTRGELVVENHRVDDIADAFRVYYAGIIMVDSSIADRHATAVLQLQDPVGSLKTLAESLHLAVTTFGDFYISIHGLAA